MENYLLVLFCVEVSGFLKIFIFCASLSLNFELRKNTSWKEYLHKYNDVRLLQFLTYGLQRHLQRENVDNHTSATVFAGDVDTFLVKEALLGAIMGLFDQIPSAQCHFYH